MDTATLKGLNSLYSNEHGLNYTYKVDDNGVFVVDVVEVDDLPLISKSLINRGVIENTYSLSKYLPGVNANELINHRTKIVFNGKVIDYDFIKVSDEFQNCINTFLESCKKEVKTNSHIHEAKFPTAHGNRIEKEIKSDNDYFYVYPLLYASALTFEYEGKMHFVTEDTIKDFCDNSEYAKDEEMTYDDVVSVFVQFFNDTAMEGEQGTTQTDQFYNCIMALGWDANSKDSLYYDYWFRSEIFLMGIGKYISSNPYEFAGQDTYPLLYQYVKYFEEKN